MPVAPWHGWHQGARREGSAQKVELHIALCPWVFGAKASRPVALALWGWGGEQALEGAEWPCCICKAALV